MISEFVIIGGPAPDTLVHELAALGEAAVPALIDGAALDNRDVQRLAIRALALIPARSTVAALLNFAERAEEGDYDIAAMALRGAIASLTPDDATRVSAYMQKMTRHPDAFVRAAAATALARVQDQSAQDVLMALAADEDEFAATAARDALTALAAAPIGSQANARIDQGGASGDASVPAKSVDRVNLLARLVATDRVTRERAQVELLASKEALEVIKAHIAEDNPRLQRALLEAVAMRPQPQLFDTLVALIDNPKTSDDTRTLALRALAPSPRHTDDQLFGWLQRFAKHPDPLVRAASALALIRAPGRRCHRALVGLMRDTDEFVRESAARAWSTAADRERASIIPDLGRMLGELAHLQYPPTEFLVPLLDGLTKAAAEGAYIDDDLRRLVSTWTAHHPPRVVDAARACLEAMTPSSGRGIRLNNSPIATWLDDDDPDVVDNALSALEDGRSYTVDNDLDALLAFLYRATDDQLVRVAPLLATSDDPRARSALNNLAQHTVERVAQAARACLTQLH